ncbi:hypothetical protein GCM10008019_45100 [Deinococcus soli (ex Cha et al. 2016)]|nr:hypothetical protein GCM10008019_45100 [Deinococcus soli (ex Cha et al. 2016)]
MKLARTTLFGTGLLSVGAAAPYAQQTSFGVPSPLIQAAQAETSVPSTWQVLPATAGGRLETPVMEVAPFNELIPSWNVTGPAAARGAGAQARWPLDAVLRIRHLAGQWRAAQRARHTHS